MRNNSFGKTLVRVLWLALVLIVQSSSALAQARVAVLPGNGQITLKWTPVAGATSYNLYMATQSGVSKTSTGLPGYMVHAGVGSPFTHTGLANGTTHYFLVTAVTASEESPVSLEIVATPSASVGAALAGVNAFFSQFGAVLNAHNPPVKSPSDLANTHLAGFFDAAYLNEGRNSALEAKRMAQDMRGMGAIDSLVIDHVNFYDETNQIISVEGVATTGGMAEFVGGGEDGFFILKRQADNSTWLSYGDQRLVKGDFQVEMRTERAPFFNAGPRQRVNFHVEAPAGTVSSASVSGPELASPLPLEKGSVRVETIVGDPAQPAETFYRDRFYAGFDPGTAVQAGTTYNLTVNRAAGGTETYPMTFRKKAVTDAVAGAIAITSPTGHALADAHLGSPLGIQWTLPTAYPIASVQLGASVATAQSPASGYWCEFDENPAPSATSGTVNIPATCNGLPVVQAWLTVRTNGANGESSFFGYGFWDAVTGGGTTTTTTTGPTTTTTSTGSTTTTVGSTTTTTQGGGAGTVTANLVAGWNLLGNGGTAAIDVSAFNDTSKITTVWRWVANTAKWAFYAPSLVGQALTDYANSKGYDVLTGIDGGEGFWVNAKIDFSTQFSAPAAVSSSSFQTQPGGSSKLLTGWNLIAVGDNKTPSAFNTAIGETPPAAGDIPLNVTTLWAWDAALSNWYFYAPSLEKNGLLLDYIQSKNYLDFGTKTLTPTTGFWVNKP